jgi:hypothetical protein
MIRIIFHFTSTIYAPEPLMWRASSRASAVKEGWIGVEIEGSEGVPGGSEWELGVPIRRSRAVAIPVAGTGVRAGGRPGAEG